MALADGHRHVDGAAGAVIRDGVLYKIDDELVDEFPVPADAGRRPLECKEDGLLLRVDLQLVAAVLRHGVEINLLKLSRNHVTVVHLGKVDDIIDEGKQAVRIVADLLQGPGFVLPLDHIILNELGIAGDGCEGRLQFV